MDISLLMVVKNEGRDSENSYREKLNQLLFAYRNSICGCSRGGACSIHLEKNLKEINENMNLETLDKNENMLYNEVFPYFDDLDLVFDLKNKRWYCETCYRFRIDKSNGNTNYSGSLF